MSVVTPLTDASLSSLNRFFSAVLSSTSSSRSAGSSSPTKLARVSSQPPLTPTLIILGSVVPAVPVKPSPQLPNLVGIGISPVGSKDPLDGSQTSSALTPKDTGKILVTNVVSVSLTCFVTETSSLRDAERTLVVVRQFWTFSRISVTSPVRTVSVSNRSDG